MKAKKLAIGELYRVRFKDHVVDSSGLIVCSAVGWVIEIGEDFVVLSYWTVHDDNPETVKNNLETFTIIKSTIISMKRLR